MNPPVIKVARGHAMRILTLCSRCAACRFMSRLRGVPCVKHTRPSERPARAKAIGVVR